MSEREYLAALFLMALAPKKKSPKVLALTIWLFDRWEKLSTVRKAFYRWLIARAAVLTVHSKSYLGLVQSMFSEADVRLTYFGISADSFPLAQPIAENRTGKLRIFSAGNDQSRDWGTLFEALGGDERFEVVVAIRGIEAKQVRRFSNFTVLDPANIAGFRASYSWADFTVIPMKPNRYSGITVALEATASGSTLICSDTGGVPTYLSHDEAIFVPPGDPVALRNAALAVGAGPRGHVDWAKVPADVLEIISELLEAAASLGWSTDTLTKEVLKAHERTQQGTPAGRFAAFANHLMNAAETRTAQAA